jgi:hypothetical protein
MPSSACPNSQFPLRHLCYLCVKPFSFPSFFLYALRVLCGELSLYLLQFPSLLYFLYFVASLSNFTLVYKTRNPCRMIFLCDTLPGCARLTAIVHPASAARCNRACSSAVCTPRLRKSGNVLAPNNPATVPRRASVAPPATCPSTRAK